MGPRSLDRGNGFVRPKLSEPQAVFNGAAISRSRKSAGSQRPEKVAGCLQWGRDLSIAEIARQRLLHYQEFPRLQWGRDLSIAEIHRPVVWVSNFRFSSMGPRSLDRGNGLIQHSTSEKTSFFNGAAISRSRKYADLDVVGLGRVSSMGPRSLDRGNQ